MFFQLVGKKIILISLSVILFVTLHIPLAFAGGWNFSAVKYKYVGTNLNTLNDSLVKSEAKNTVYEVDGIYHALQLEQQGLSKKIFDYAMKGFMQLREKGKLDNENIISIVDFSLPSSQKRLFVIDLDEVKLVFNTYVAHGVNSGKLVANSFSNTPQSLKSSLGFYTTRNTYNGEHGYSLKLDGLEKGINDNAYRRAIVIHAANYVNESLVKAQGYLGRSWGCPALPEKLYKPIINTIKDGSCLFIYGKDKNYLKQSKIINS